MEYQKYTRTKIYIIIFSVMFVQMKLGTMGVGIYYLISNNVPILSFDFFQTIFGILFFNILIYIKFEPATVLFESGWLLIIFFNIRLRQLYNTPIIDKRINEVLKEMKLYKIIGLLVILLAIPLIMLLFFYDLFNVGI